MGTRQRAVAVQALADFVATIFLHSQLHSFTRSESLCSPTGNTGKFPNEFAEFAPGREPGAPEKSGRAEARPVLFIENLATAFAQLARERRYNPSKHAPAMPSAADDGSGTATGPAAKLAAI